MILLPIITVNQVDQLFKMTSVKLETHNFSIERKTGCYSVLFERQSGMQELQDIAWSPSSFFGKQGSCFMIVFFKVPPVKFN